MYEPKLARFTARDPITEGNAVLLPSGCYSLSKNVKSSAATVGMKTAKQQVRMGEVNDDNPQAKKQRVQLRKHAILQAYVYAKNSPVVFIDPSGCVSCRIHILGGHTWNVKAQTAASKLVKDGKLRCNVLQVGFVSCGSRAIARNFSKKYNVQLLKGLDTDIGNISFPFGAARFLEGLNASFKQAPLMCKRKNCKGKQCTRISIVRYCAIDMKKAIEKMFGIKGLKQLCKQRQIFNCLAKKGKGRWEKGGPNDV